MTQTSTGMQAIHILIIDDHQLLLNGTVEIVKDLYPNGIIRTAQTAQAALEQALEQATEQPLDLAIVDLSLPESLGSSAQVETGLNLLQTLMKQFPDLNLMVQSSNINALIRLMFDIDDHQGGFTILDKGLPVETFSTRLEWARQGLTYTKGLQTDLEIKPEWLEVLRLAFEEGLQDKGIAQSMYKSERMIRHYWTKLQNVLEVYPEPGKSMRTLVQIRAREKGLLD
ncbi:MAG: response regulator transcription factor [Cyanobacteria bacterium P01_D01_bin.105]